jgi:hypothetical protein
LTVPGPHDTIVRSIKNAGDADQDLGGATRFLEEDA